MATTKKTSSRTTSKTAAKAETRTSTSAQVIDIDNIGMTAGQIWNYLNSNGERTLTQMTKDLDLNSNFAQMGIGWLAKEGKLEFSRSGNSTKVRLI